MNRAFHRLALILLVLATWLSCAPPSRPIPEPFATAPAALAPTCGPCGGGVDLGHILAICPASQPLWTAELTCLRGPCQGACVGFLAEYDACVSSGDPACTWSNWPSCNDCETTPDALGGCNAEVTACGTDRTGCVTCASWLGGTGDPAWLCPYDSLDAAAELSDCACSGACAMACAGACGTTGALTPAAAGKACQACLSDRTRCGGARAACARL